MLLNITGCFKVWLLYFLAGNGCWAEFIESELILSEVAENWYWVPPRDNVFSTVQSMWYDCKWKVWMIFLYFHSNYSLFQLMSHVIIVSITERLTTLTHELFFFLIGYQRCRIFCGLCEVQWQLCLWCWWQRHAGLVPADSISASWWVIVLFPHEFQIEIALVW